MCHWYSCCPLKISLFTVMGRYLSGKSMLSSSVFLVNALPSLRSVCFMRCGTRPPARCKITHVRQLRRALHPVESLDITRIGSRSQGCGGAWWGEDVLERAYSRADTGSTRWMGPLCGRRCCRWTAGCPPGAPKTKGDAHALEIQSLVTQKSWDRLSGWQANSENC